MFEGFGKLISIFVLALIGITIAITATFIRLAESPSETPEQSQSFGSASQVIPAIGIAWQDPGMMGTATAATPEQVVDATISRLQYVQTTPHASDRNARVLWHLVQAQDVYAGREIDQSPKLNGMNE